MSTLNPALIQSLLHLCLIGLLIAGAFVIAARFRHFWGTTPLAVLAGLFLVPQTLLAMGLRIEVSPGLTISPGSVVFFPAILFAILLVYVLEDEVEARRLVYGIILANLVFALLIVIGQPLISGVTGDNPLALGFDRSIRLAWVLVAGTLLLAFDALVLVRAFEWFGERVSRNTLLRAMFALCLSAGIDALLFSVIAFGTRPRFGATLLIGLIGKIAAGSFYSMVFVALLPWSRLSVGPESMGEAKGTPGPVTYKDRFEDLQKMAVRDALTGVFNRAYFDHELRNQTDRARLRGDRLLLLLIDLDKFKEVNDTHGHPAGDRVLTIFGEALRAVARQNDTVCRYGGEEFAVLIAGSPTSIAPVLFARLGEELERLWRDASPPLGFPSPRFSVGAAAVPDDADTPDKLLALADKRLYVSKRAGGDQLSIA